MKTNSSLTINYHIKSFMLDKLHLGGAELLLFAIIHSFSRGECKLYYGSQELLARSIGMSLSTVKRILQTLKKKGYIEKCRIRSSDGCRILEGYRSTKYCAAIENKYNSGTLGFGAQNAKALRAYADIEDAENEAILDGAEDIEDAENEAILADGEDIEDAENEAILDGAEDIEDAENEAILADGEDITASLDKTDKPRHHHDTYRPKHIFQAFGRDELVSMTDEQYQALSRLVNEERLMAYIRKLELLILKQGYHPFSHYKTIKGWILADAKI